MSTGRKKDDIWIQYDEINIYGKPKRAVCKKCKLEMAPIVLRMKQHSNTICKKLTAMNDVDNIDENLATVKDAFLGTAKCANEQDSISCKYL